MAPHWRAERLDQLIATTCSIACIFIFLFVYQSKAEGDHGGSPEWTYSNQVSWGQAYPLCQSSNMRQSPIDIQTDNVVLRPDLHLDFVDYDQEVEFELKNTHHSVSLKPVPLLSQPTIKLNWIHEPNQEFELGEIHFHWGDGLNKGSEHEINGQAGAAEMHMVHFQKGIDRADIGSVENSVVVVGVLIESDNSEHQKLENLVADCTNVNGTDTVYKSEVPENLINLLPDQHQVFYTYNGSLTTPPCYEVVTWVVMSQPVYMKNERLIELSNLEANTAKGRHKISANRRSVQPLLDRPVYASFNVSELVSPDFRMVNENFMISFDSHWRKIQLLRESLHKAYEAMARAGQRLTSFNLA